MNRQRFDGPVYLAGGSPAAFEQFEEAFGAGVRRGVPDARDRDAVVFLDASGGWRDTRWGNPFSACCALKGGTGPRVFVLARASDPHVAEIARFCLADGCLMVDDDGRILDFEALERYLGDKRPKASVDDLLTRLEERIAVDERKRESGLQRMLEAPDDDGLLAHLTDGETGLFDGPFASFKLDEEFKRATRFHQPLSLILLDCGVVRWPADPSVRRTALAEMASVFLTECRDIDILSRFTENVFLFLLPGTGAGGAATVGRRMLEGLLARELEGDVVLDPAIGVVTVPATGIRDRTAFLREAESCLDRARSLRGAERLCVAAP